MLLAMTCNIGAMDDNQLIAPSNTKQSNSQNTSKSGSQKTSESNSPTKDALSRKNSDELIQKLKELKTSRDNIQGSHVHSPSISGPSSGFSTPVNEEITTKYGYITSWPLSKDIPIRYQSVSFEQKDTEENNIYSCTINCEDEHKNKSNIILQVTDKYVDQKYAVVTEKDNTFAIELKKPESIARSNVEVTGFDVVSNKEVIKDVSTESDGFRDIKDMLKEEIDKQLQEEQREDALEEVNNNNNGNNKEASIEKITEEKITTTISQEKEEFSIKSKSEKGKSSKDSLFTVKFSVIAIVVALFMYKYNMVPAVILNFINKALPVNYQL